VPFGRLCQRCVFVALPWDVGRLGAQPCNLGGTWDLLPIDRRFATTPVDARAEGEMNDTDAHFWHPWLRIHRVLRVMLHAHWRAEARAQVKAEFKASRRAAERDPTRGVVRLTR
jgi:hypothetical protein